MGDSTQGWAQLESFFPKSGHFSRFSKKDRGDLLSSPPPRYVHVKRISRSTIIVEINTKDVKLVKTNISSLHSTL